MSNRSIIFDGDEFTHAGRTFIVHIESEDDATPPWERADCHGPVSEWTSRNKLPGEWVLNSDGRGRARNGRSRFYDAEAATRIAKRDRWGIGDDARAALAAKLGREPTAGEVTAEAVRRDYEFLRGWCADEWHYVGVCVRHVSQDDGEKYTNALWGIESSEHEYIAEVAAELAEQCAAELDKEAAATREAMARMRGNFRELARDVRASAGAGLRPAVCAAVRDKLAAIVECRRKALARLAELAA